VNSDPGSQLFFAVLLVTAFTAAGAQAQAPAPAAAAEPPTKPHPPLKLRLDDAALRSLIKPGATEKKQDSSGLPSLGGSPAPDLERTPSQVVPKDQTPGL
jgi:hypothetical protein